MAVAAFGLVTGNMRAQSSAASVNPQGVIVVTNASGGLTTITNPILAEIPAAYQGTVETVLAWASSVNTNLSYGRVIGWTGPVYQNGVNIADEIGMSYDLYTSSATDGYFVAAEARFRNAGVLGTIVSAGGGIQLEHLEPHLAEVEKQRQADDADKAYD